MKPLLKHSQCINFLNAPLNFGLSSSDHWLQHYQHLFPLPSCSLTGQHEMDAKGLLCPTTLKSSWPWPLYLSSHWQGLPKQWTQIGYSFATTICSGGHHPPRVSLFLEFSSIISASAMMPKPLFLQVLKSKKEQGISISFLKINLLKIWRHFLHMHPRFFQDQKQWVLHIIINTISICIMSSSLQSSCKPILLFWLQN